jgi:lipopolysaccharide export LptBFGC system permease protein LptF
MATFSILNKKNETVVFASLGISPMRFVVSIFSVLIMLYVFVSVVLLPMNSRLSLASEKILHKSKETGVFFKSSDRSFFIKSEKINCGNTTEMLNVTLWILNQDFSLAETIKAKKGLLENSGLILQDVISMTDGKHNHSKEKSLLLDVTSKDILVSTLRPEQANFFALPSSIKTLSKLGLDSTPHSRYFHDKITLIISFFTMALIGFGASYNLVAKLIDRKRFFYGGLLGLSMFFVNNLITTMFLSQSYSIGFSILMTRLLLLSIAIGYVQKRLVK